MDFSYFLSMEFMASLISNYWYLGAFLVGMMSSMFIFLPSPAFLIIFFSASQFNPFLLGLVAGIGAAVGEMFGYYLGRFGGAVIAKKYDKQLKKIESNFYKYRPSVFLFLFSASPMPFEYLGVFCGIIRFKRRFFIPPVVAGKIVKYWAIAYAGFYGINWVTGYLGY